MELNSIETEVQISRISVKVEIFMDLAQVDILQVFIFMLLNSTALHAHW